MDVLVDSYVPEWLHNVNREQNVAKVSLPVVNRYDQRQRYISSFSGTDVWQTTKVATRPELANSGKEIDAFQQLVADLLRILKAEENSRIQLTRSWNRYEIQARPWGSTGALDKSSQTVMLACSIPGIQDFNPPASINDLVELRQLIPLAKSFDGYVHVAKVTAVKRSKNQVILTASSLKFHSGYFNLTFVHDDSAMQTQVRLLETIKNTASPWLVSYVLPTLGSCRLKTQQTNHREYAWKDSQLNLEQMKAVQDIIEHRYGELPYLISGPPGTGKTKTVVEAILQLLESDEDVRIIACGPSNTAADTLALRLIAYLRAPKVLLRLNADSRSFEEVPESLLPFSNIENDSFSMPAFAELMAYRVIVGTLSEVSELSEVSCNNESLAQLEQFTMKSLHPGKRFPDPRPHFTHLFLDEAGQATAPESLCAFRIMEPGPGQFVSIILAGDQQQLGPRVMSEEARQGGLNRSLFERLIDNTVYSNHPLSRQSILRNSFPTLPYPHAPFTNLYRNYRSHEAILTIPSQLSYESSLSACALNVNTIARAIDDRIPVSFIGHRGAENTADMDVITTWYNETEIRLIVQKVQQLLHTKQTMIQARDIAVLAPFREQVKRLRLALRKVNLSAVGVGTVEDYQGAESRIVIISIVRSSEKYLAKDKLNDAGLINAKRRMNVALTRAKELLIVVGNPDLLSLDESWKTWLAFCKQYDTYHDVKKPLAPATRGAWNMTSAVDKKYELRADEFPALGTEKR